jgi:hypothetical protein
MTDPIIEAYIVVIKDTGNAYEATAYPAGHTQVDGGIIIEARANISGRAIASAGEAWNAGADALATAMPEPEYRADKEAEHRAAGRWADETEEQS